MNKRFFVMVSMCLCVIFAGCTPVPKQEQWPDTPILSHLNISQKKVYIHSIKNSLSSYRRLAEDLGQREKPESFIQLGQESDKFVQMYVVPITEDADAASNLETKLDVAKLQLLSGLTYADLGMASKAKQCFARISEKYGSDASIMSATLGEPDLGYATFGDGVSALKQILSRK